MYLSFNTLADLFEKGYQSATIRFSYIPDFKNKDESKAYADGLSLGYNHKDRVAEGTAKWVDYDLEMEFKEALAKMLPKLVCAEDVFAYHWSLIKSVCESSPNYHRTFHLLQNNPDIHNNIRTLAIEYIDYFLTLLEEAHYELNKKKVSEVQSV